MNLQRVALLVVLVAVSVGLPAAAQEPDAPDRSESESDCVCPKEGRWMVTNLEGWMQCVGTFGMKRKLKGKDRNRGIVWILEEDCSSLFLEAGEKKREDGVMDRVEDCKFEGTYRGVEDGVDVVVNGTMTMESDKFATGEAYWNMDLPEDEEGEEGEEGKKKKKKKKKNKQSMAGMGMSCKAHRPFEIAFEEPLSEEEYPELKKRMEKKLEEVLRTGSSGSVDK